MTILLKEKNSNFKIYCNKINLRKDSIFIPEYASFDLLSYGDNMTAPLNGKRNYEIIHFDLSFEQLKNIVVKGNKRKFKKFILPGL
ncbi:hypothetical protein N2384_11785 [Bacillus paralicheniformis]|uniref:hypothetical protein n=1 Tax=Bacillus paralicheniformis TaxID=1648923 RepID=UPI0021A27CE5|nr:hypothetical protein [Bacillus paralicheniformis]UWS63423.1 hypothetical protein N2384_11785 [Bacillus paralicheniformis]